MSVNEIEEPGDDDAEEEQEDDAAGGSNDGNDDEASFEQFLSKAKSSSDSDDDDDEETVLELTREERLESLSIRAAPKQPNEFVCSSCRLVKHESQMADRTRELCRDCV